MPCLFLDILSQLPLLFPDAICKELDRLDPEGKVDYEEWLAQYWKRLDDRRSGSV